MLAPSIEAARGRATSNGTGERREGYRDVVVVVEKESRSRQRSISRLRCRRLNLLAGRAERAIRDRLLYVYVVGMFWSITDDERALVDLCDVCHKGDHGWGIAGTVRDGDRGILAGENVVQTSVRKIVHK